MPLTTACRGESVRGMRILLVSSIPIDCNSQSAPLSWSMANKANWSEPVRLFTMPASSSKAAVWRCVWLPFLGSRIQGTIHVWLVNLLFTEVTPDDVHKFSTIDRFGDVFIAAT